MQNLGKLNQKLLLVPKLLYFTLSAAFYIFHQFRSQFISDRYKVQNDNLGLYLSVPQAISFFLNIWAGSVNDRSGKQRAILLFLLGSSAIFFQIFFLSDSLIVFCITFTMYFSLLSSTLPLLDKVMLDYISEIPGMDSKALGRQRIWSTFGYVVNNFIVEDLITKKGAQKGKKKEYNYDKMQYINWVVVGLAGLSTFLFVNNLPRRSVSSNHSSSLKALLKNFEYLYFIFIILLCGISRAFMTNYLGIYYSKVLRFEHQPNTIKAFWPLNIVIDMMYTHKQSTSTFFGIFMEVILFFNSTRITNVLGYFWPILLSQILQFCRFIAYCSFSYTNNSSFSICCLIELLKGANYALIHTSAVQIANSFCPPRLRTTSQLFYNGTFVALGNVLSGIVFKPFFSKISKKEEDVDKIYQEFQVAFKWNAYFSLLGIAFFVYKYGIRENLLFNRENADEKVMEIERQAREEDEPSAPAEDEDDDEMEEEIEVVKKRSKPSAKSISQGA